MDWMRENWFWIAVAVFFVWMHLRMHGGHGHGGHGGGCCGGARHGDEGEHGHHPPGAGPAPPESTGRREHDHA